MKHFAVTLAIVLATGAGIFLLAGRSTGEMAGYVKATADVTVENATDALPVEIHDRKLDHELQQVRQETIDRQVKMNLSRRQVDDLTQEVERLAGSVQRRERLLAEAYPVLKAATDDRMNRVVFANEEYELSQFQQEIDDLLSLQDRETRELKIKRAGLDRLRQGIDEGERVLADMRRELKQTEMEVSVLRSRREQAETESQTLDLVSAAAGETESVAGLIAESVDRLRGDVDRLEASNAARRDVAPIGIRVEGGSAGRAFNRLESLKSIHDSVEQPTGAASGTRDSSGTDSDSDSGQT